MSNTNERRRKKPFMRILKYKIFRKRNIFSLLILLLVIIFIIFLANMDILPIKYYLIVSLVLFFINLLGICLINVHRKIILKVLGIIILFILLIGLSIGLFYLSSTNNFINDSFSNENLFDKNTYYVVTLTSNNLSKSDINGDIGVYSETVNIAQAIDKLNDKYQVNEVKYDDIGLMFDNLNNRINRFILIEKSSYEIVFSLSETLNRSDYVVLYEFDIFTKKSVNKNKSTDKFNIFVGGTDFAGLMDFNMIVSINTDTHQVLLTSIPRDYYIEVAGKDGRYDKLSFMNAYGANTNKDSLANLFKIDIDYSVKIDTNSLISVVDYVGGIDFCSDYSFTTTHALVSNTYNDYGKKLTINKGCQHLNGIETLTVARERNAFPGRDRVRQENCQKIIVSIFKELMSKDAILHYNETLNTLNSLYETDLPREAISNIIKDILNYGNNFSIETQSVNGEDGQDKVHLSNMVDWVMYPDYSTVDNAKEKINETLK